MTGDYHIHVNGDHHPDTIEILEQAEQVVAAELDEDESLPRWAVVRELAEAYVGNQPLGQWREDRDHEH